MGDIYPQNSVIYSLFTINVSSYFFSLEPGSILLLQSHLSPPRPQKKVLLLLTSTSLFYSSETVGELICYLTSISISSYQISNIPFIQQCDKFQRAHYVPGIIVVAGDGAHSCRYRQGYAASEELSDIQEKITSSYFASGTKVRDDILTQTRGFLVQPSRV